MVDAIGVGVGVLVSQDLSFHPYGQNWHLDRAAFDTLCRDRAVACGASLMRGQITEIARHDETSVDGRVRGGTTQIVTSACRRCNRSRGRVRAAAG